MNGAVIALVATGLYYVGSAVFKVSATRMKPLHGTRPLHLFGQMFANRIWLVGLVIVSVGFVLQLNALTMLPLAVAQPIFVSTLVLLLWIAVGYFGERLTAREWLGLALFAVATLMLAMSVVPGQKTDSGVPAQGLFLAVAIPSLLLPVVVFSIGDLRPAGRHARPLSGVAYGLSSGVLIGTCELAVKGVTNAYDSGVHDMVTLLLVKPYVYVIFVGAVVGICQAQIALQRCRLAIVLSICTVVAKTQLVVMGTLLYGEAWPRDPLWSSLRVAGFALGIAAVAFFPRYEDPEQQLGREDVADLVQRPGPARHSF